jgi:SOS-response transcriptional repressor LexA
MIATKQHGGRRAGAGRRPGPPTKVVRLPAPLADLAREMASAKTYGDVAGFIDVEGRSALRVPMMAWSAACGFPSPAEDYIDRPLDFNELLIEHPAATFAIRIEGESMTGAGIFPGDIAVVDRAREPVNGNVVLALLDGAFTVKRYRTKDGAVWLQAENPAFPDMPIADSQALEVWGVITRSIRML